MKPPYALSLKAGPGKLSRGQPKIVNKVILMFYKLEFYRPDIIRISFELRKELSDYIDCIIAATAISLGEDLLTEDRLIHSLKDNIEREYGIRIYSHKGMLNPPSQPT